MRAIIQGQTNAVKTYFHEPLIAPLAVFKRTIQGVYGKLFDVLFLASTGKQSFDDGANGLLFGLGFVLLCVAAFYLKEREVVIFFLLLTIFVIDKYCSRLHYLNLDSKHTTLLKTKGETTFFEEFPRGRMPQRQQFRSESLNTIWIDRHELAGGAFQERLDVVWRVRLHFVNPNSIIIFHHGKSASEAYRKALEIANSYSIPKPITFSNSVGSGANGLAQLSDPEKIFYINKCRNTVEFKNASPDQWSIRSCWCFESYFRMIRYIVRAIFFSLALVVTVNLMAELGAVFVQLAQRSPSNEILKTALSVRSTLLPANNWTEISEIAVISLAMLSKQLNLSMTEEIKISKDSFEYYLNKKLLGRIRTQNIKNMLLIEDDEPVILVGDQNQVIEIPGLQTPEEFKAFLYRIIESVEYFQSC